MSAGAPLSASRSSIRPAGGAAGRERAKVTGLAALIVVAIGVYAFVRSAGGGRDEQRDLMPYQALVRTLSTSDARMFQTLQAGLVAAEAVRAQLRRWPEPFVLAAQGIPPFAPGPAGATAYSWTRFQVGQRVDYLGIPAAPADPAWLLVIQEPEPGAPPDTSPLDEEHHRLPDGTPLHVYAWMHRYGGRVSVAFVPSPQGDGWTQILTAPLNPVQPRS